MYDVLCLQHSVSYFPRVSEDIFEMRRKSVSQIRLSMSPHGPSRRTGKLGKNKVDRHPPTSSTVLWYVLDSEFILQRELSCLFHPFGKQESHRRV